jgi:two-component sensor histidine kinase
MREQQMTSQHISSSARTSAPPLVPRDAIAESNHRIASNLTLVSSMVRMHARSIAASAEPMTNDKVRAVLEEIGARIEAIANLHGLLARHDHGRPIDLSDYLREICEVVVSSLIFVGTAQLNYESNSECLIAPERALPAGLIIGELVTNAVKYAHPAGVIGEITVSCNSEPGATVITVADDGVGLPEGFDPKQEGGLGLRLVRSLADQLGAKLTYDSTGIGLSVSLRIETPR